MRGLRKRPTRLVAVLGLVVALALPGVASSNESAPDGSSSYLPVSVSPSSSGSRSRPSPRSADALQRLRQPWAVRATVVMDAEVRVAWKAEGAHVRYFLIMDNGQRLPGHVPASNRHADVDTSYGRHCLRVVAVAKKTAEDSSPSACGTVVVSEPEPTLMGTWRCLSSCSGFASVLVVGDGTWYWPGTMNIHGTWRRCGTRYCFQSPDAEGFEAELRGDLLIEYETCCAAPGQPVRHATYARATSG